MSKIIVITIAEKEHSDQFRFPEGSHGVSIEAEASTLALPPDDFILRYVKPACAQLLLNEKEKR